MRIDVESDSGDHGIDIVRRMHFDGRTIEIAENIDQWHGPGYRYHKLKGHDGHLYILRHDELRAEWELTLFRSAEADERSTSLRPESRGVPT